MMILDFGRYLNIKTIHKTNHKTSQKVKNGKYYKRGYAIFITSFIFITKNERTNQYATVLSLVYT